MGPDCYGDDRLFVFLETPACSEVSAAVDQLEHAGHPVARVHLQDCARLGAEFFRWEYATAVAGSILDVHPFDQPDVQGAKDNTDALLGLFHRDGTLPPRAPSGSIRELLDQARPGDYLAVNPYVPMNSETDRLLRELKTKAMQHCHIATTSGYGPRYLHSTGQLHKGGPATGLHLQFTMSRHRPLRIPARNTGSTPLPPLRQSAIIRPSSISAVAWSPSIWATIPSQGCNASSTTFSASFSRGLQPLEVLLWNSVS